jgi:hypothetical protein
VGDPDSAAATPFGLFHGRRQPLARPAVGNRALCQRDGLVNRPQKVRRHVRRKLDEQALRAPGTPDRKSHAGQAGQPLQIHASAHAESLFKRGIEGSCCASYSRATASAWPYVNRLFRNIGYSIQHYTLLILVTPRVIISG